MGISESGISGTPGFPSTSWSVVRHGQDPTSPDYQRHLRRLIQLYWRPIYTVIRHGWKRSPEDTKDLTQEFFATVVLDGDLLKRYEPERGSFRALVRAAVRNFMLNTVRDATWTKRGGGLTPVFIDDVRTSRAVPFLPADTASPEEILDQAWRHTVITEAVKQLKAKLLQQGKKAVFEVWKRYDLDGDSAELSYADLGRQLSLSGPQVKRALLDARVLFRKIVTDIVRAYVDGPDSLESELRLVFGA